MRNYDLTILPVQDHLVQRRPLRRPIHPNLPDIYKGAVVLLIGKVKAGKSTTILNWALNPNFYKDAFDEVYVITPTLHQDKTLAPLLDEFMTARTQATHLIFTRITSKKEREIIKETYGDNFGDGENFLKMLDYATQDAYSKLYVDLDNMKVYKNFTELIYPGKFS